MIMFTPSTRATRCVRGATAAVALILCGGSVTPAAAGNLCISMADSNGQVAGIQVDLKWDGACMSADQGAGAWPYWSVKRQAGQSARRLHGQGTGDTITCRSLLVLEPPA